MILAAAQRSFLGLTIFLTVFRALSPYSDPAPTPSRGVAQHPEVDPQDVVLRAD